MTPRVIWTLEQKTKSGAIVPFGKGFTADPEEAKLIQEEWLNSIVTPYYANPPHGDWIEGFVEAASISLPVGDHRFVFRKTQQHPFDVPAAIIIYPKE
jgi:hypothetical protein